MPALPVAIRVVDKAQIVQLILEGDPVGGDLLYQHYARGLLFLARRYSLEHAEDCIHDAVLCAIEQIRAGKLTTPEALPGYLATILKRTVWNMNLASKRRAGDQKTFDNAVSTWADEREDPSRLWEVKERARLMKDGLQRLKPIGREILTRFYAHEQTREEICRAMNLTETQFRLLKCHSKKVLTKQIAQATVRPVSEERFASAAFAN